MGIGIILGRRVRAGSVNSSSLVGLPNSTSWNSSESFVVAVVELLVGGFTVVGVFGVRGDSVMKNPRGTACSEQSQMKLMLNFSYKDEAVTMKIPEQLSTMWTF